MKYNRFKEAKTVKFCQLVKDRKAWNGLVQKTKIMLSCSVRRRRNTFRDCRGSEGGYLRPGTSGRKRLRTQIGIVTYFWGLWKRKRWFVAEFLAACASVQSRQGICELGCPRTWTVAAMSAVKWVGVATNSSYELIENNTFKNNT